MNNKIILREATVQDCQCMLELVKELATYEKAPEQVTITLKEFEDAGFGRRKIWKGFVLEKNLRIIGTAICYVRFSTWKGNMLYLEDLIITEKERGNGYGQLLLDRCIEYAKNNNYVGMMWQVLDWNEPAINFYKKYNAEFDSDWLNVKIHF